MTKINYDGRRFRSVQNTGSGEVGSETLFHYHQDGNIVWAEYAGGEIVRGQLIATCDDAGGLDMRYQHINSRGDLMTGTSVSTPEVLPDGRLRLHEVWHWTCGVMSAGRSTLEET